MGFGFHFISPKRRKRGNYIQFASGGLLFYVEIFMYFMNKPVHIYERTIMKVPILFVLLMSLNDFDGTY